MRKYSYKVIFVDCDEPKTREYANPATDFEEAKKIAESLLDKFYNDERYHNDFSDCHVAVYPFDEDIKFPLDDYPVVFRDIDGNHCWSEMKMGTYGRIGIKPLYP